MSPDVAASVRARLLNQKQAGEEFERTLARFAAERLLYRLGRSSAGERCILKGASLLVAWLKDPYRATRDVDVLLTGPADDAAIRSMLEEICAMACPEDGLVFDLSELAIEMIRPEEEYAGKRARFRAQLGSARIAVQLDLGVGDALVSQPETIVYPTMLATLPPPRVRAYTREASIAEKFEAMVKLDTRNSRMKDFHDMWALSGAFAFDGLELHRAVAACFERRSTAWTAEPPRALTQDFYALPELAARWRSYLARGSTLVTPPADFAVVGERVVAFLGPLRAATTAGEPFARLWQPGGPWEEAA